MGKNTAISIDDTRNYSFEELDAFLQTLDSADVESIVSNARAKVSEIYDSVHPKEKAVA